MRFMNILTSVTVFGAALSNGAAAQSFYGGLDGALTYSHTIDQVESESAGEPGAKIGGFLGMSLGGGLFLEGDLRFKYAEDSLATLSVENLTESALAALRFGTVRGPLAGELILGYAEVTNADGTADRAFAALAGGYALSDRLTANGIVGYVDGTGDSSSENEDAIREFAHVTLGAAYGLSDRLTLWGNASYGDGAMDAENDPLFLREVSLGADYRLAGTALKLYGALTYSDYYQGVEQDAAFDTRASIGLAWTFGGSSETSGRGRARLPDYENWIGDIAGTLE